MRNPSDKLAGRDHLGDLKRSNYIDLLEPAEYYTITPACQVRRRRVNDNLLGDIRFCSMVRRTDTLRNFEKPTCPIDAGELSSDILLKF